jgi:apolipoprotein D and lipocalin family protein
MDHAEVMKVVAYELAALVLCLPFAAQSGSAPLRVIDSVELTRYAGRWYEAARLPNKFQDHCAGDVVVHYAPRSDGRIDVVNRCRTFTGKVDQARGVARKAGDGTSTARLEVRFAPAILSFLRAVWGDYWIIGLGPEYTWAVVGTPNREYLWILSRTPEMSEASYARALEIARGNGFDVTRVVKTTNSDRAPEPR